MQLLKTNETNFAKVVVYETEAPSVEILGFGDFHIGATDFSEELLYSIPEQFPNAYLVLVEEKYAQRKMFPPAPLTYSLVRLMNGITKQVVIETYDFTSKKIGL
jgi:hypothetical protein